MSNKQIKDKIDSLRKEIETHRVAYHIHDKPTISDEVYDSLMKELISLEDKYPEYDDQLSPTKRVGGEVLEEFKKFKHTVLQWSFDNVFSFAELEKWQERNINYLVKNKNQSASFTYFSELKIDGLKIVLYYENGRLKNAVTRGDGDIGEDVTENIKTIKSIPFVIKDNISVVVMGELWMSKIEFQKINSEREKLGLEIYKNPRNTAAGTIRQLDPKVVRERKLSYFAYDIENCSKKIETQEGEISFLKEIGFATNKEGKYCKDLSEVQKMYDTWNNKRRENEEYGIDGLVVKVNEKKVFDSLGFTAKSPRAGIAYKFAAEEASAKLLDVTYQVGRTGVVTPVAELSPVELSGSTVKRATLHNFEEIERLGVKIGDTIMVRKAGDIIPQIFGVLVNLRSGKEKKIVQIKNCPVCGEGLVKDTENDGVKIICPNVYCEAKAINKLIYFASRKCANIEGLGESTVNALFEAGFVTKISDIFKLKKEQILTLEGFKEKSAQNLLDGINRAKVLPLQTFIMSLSIKNVGEETSIDLAKNFKTLDNFLSLNESDLKKVYGIGEKIIEEILLFLSKAENKKEMTEILKFVKVTDYTNTEKSSKFDNLRFVITGTFANHTRDEIEKIIRENGGSVQGSVNSKTSFLIEGVDGGSKKEKASALGIKSISIDEFLKM